MHKRTRASAALAASVTNGHALVSAPSPLKKNQTQQPVSKVINTSHAGAVPTWRNAAGNMAVIAAFYLLATLYTVQLVHWVPNVEGLNAPATTFSEARAIVHTTHLATTIGDRQVTQPGNAVAASYLLDEFRKLIVLAENRSDIRIEAEVEHATGALNMVFVHHVITNAYQNLSNVVLVIKPTDAAAAAKPALLLNAHFDNTLGSPGASDCASCVGVLLEVARVIVSDPSIQLTAPLIVLLNGAEETFVQAAHGFTSSSKWAPRVGAFINLESTGPGGPDVVFQHAGDWIIQEYAAAAKYPRGSVVGQDFFRLGLIPAETDFSIFSDPEHGAWPGLDIAFLLDAAAYHTDRDTVGRIKVGSLQASGENMLQLVPAFCARLAGDAAATEPMTADMQPSVYMDLLAHRMVTYSHTVAHQVVTAPLVLLMTLPFVLDVGGLRSSFGSALLPAVTQVLLAAALCMASLLGGLIAPAAIGVARVALLGNPMAWFGKQSVTYAIYLPVTLAALLAPYALAMDPQMDIPTTLLGTSLAQSLLAVLMTRGGGLGSGSIFAIWAAAGVLGACCAAGVRRQAQIYVALLWSAAPTLLMLLGSICYTTHAVDKLSMSGSMVGPMGPLVADLAAGAILGAGAAATIGFGGALMAHSLGTRRRVKVFALVLMAMSVSAAVLSSLYLNPYTLEAPKKVFLQHLHTQSGDGSSIARSVWSITSFDSAPITDALPDMGLGRVKTAQNEMAMFFPVSEIFNPVTFAAPPPDPKDLLILPSIRLTRKAAIPTNGSSSEAAAKLRLHLEMRLQGPSWGFVNVTGPLLAWSFTDPPPVARDPQGLGGMHFPLRFAGQEGSDVWRFWIDVPQNIAHGELRMELSCSSSSESKPLSFLAARMPPWTSLAATTTFQSVWQFP